MFRMLMMVVTACITEKWKFFQGLRCANKPRHQYMLFCGRVYRLKPILHSGLIHSRLSAILQQTDQAIAFFGFLMVT